MNEKLKKSLSFNLFLLMVLLAVAYGSYKTARQALELKEESQETKNKIEELKRKKTELEQKLAELKTKEEIERTGKESLNLKNRGENVVVVIPENQASTTATNGHGWLNTLKKLLNLK